MGHCKLPPLQTGRLPALQLLVAEVKLLPVTRSLEASGSCSSILSSLPDALEAP